MDNPESELLRRSHLSALSPEEQGEALAELGGQLFTRVVARALELMSAEDQSALASLFDTDADGEKVLAFLKEKVPNISEIASEEMASLAEDRASLLSDTTSNT